MAIDCAPGMWALHVVPHPHLLPYSLRAVATTLSCATVARAPAPTTVEVGPPLWPSDDGMVSARSILSFTHMSSYATTKALGGRTWASWASRPRLQRRLDPRYSGAFDVQCYSNATGPRAESVVRTGTRGSGEGDAREGRHVDLHMRDWEGYERWMSCGSTC